MKLLAPRFRREVVSSALKREVVGKSSHKMDIAMARKLMNAEGPPEGAISCADCINPSHPAVVASDYIGFIALGASSWILLMKLSSFKGPEADDKYFMG